MDAAASTWHKPPPRRQPTDLLARQDQASSKGPITTEMATCGFWDGDSVLPNDWPGHTCRLEPSLSMYHWCPTSVTKGHRDYKSCAPIAKCHDLYTCYKGCGALKSARDALTVTWYVGGACVLRTRKWMNILGVWVWTNSKNVLSQLGNKPCLFCRFPDSQPGNSVLREGMCFDQ